MPLKPRSAVVCWPQAFGQPLMLIRSFSISCRPLASSASVTAPARPRDAVTARLHVSAPGQDTTSPLRSARDSAMPSASNVANSTGTSAADSPTNSRFWRMVVRTWTWSPISRHTLDRARIWPLVRSPRWKVA